MISLLFLQFIYECASLFLECESSYRIHLCFSFLLSLSQKHEIQVGNGNNFLNHLVCAVDTHTHTHIHGIIETTLDDYSSVIYIHIGAKQSKQFMKALENMSERASEYG